MKKLLRATLCILLALWLGFGLTTSTVAVAVPFAVVQSLNSGIPSNAIRIRTEAELRSISGGTTSVGRYYVLENDIHLVQEWIPLVDFRGTLNGQGYAIHNLFVLASSNRDNAGFFATTSNANIRNITINIGIAGITSNPSGQTGDSVAGGLIAQTRDSLNVINTHVIGNVTATYQRSVHSSGSTAGGLIGSFYSRETNNRIERSSFVGNVFARHNFNSAYAGGLIGHSRTRFGNGNLIILNAFTQGSVLSIITDSRSNSRSAGLIGLSSGRVRIENAYSASEVSAFSNPQGRNWTQALGEFWDAQFPFLVNSFWCVMQDASCHFAIGLTPTQMRNQASFTGWDFENVWAINPSINDGFPYLRTISSTTPVINVTGVSIAGNATRNMNVGTTLQLSATVTPANATNRNVTWTSSNTAVATVNTNGLVTARAGGTTTITVRTADGNRSASVTVNVTVPVTGVSIAGNATRNMNVGTTLQLSATVTPTNATKSNLPAGQACVTRTRPKLRRSAARSSAAFVVLATGANTPPLAVNTKNWCGFAAHSTRWARRIAAPNRCRKIFCWQKWLRPGALTTCSRCWCRARTCFHLYIATGRLTPHGSTAPAAKAGHPP